MGKEQYQTEKEFIRSLIANIKLIKPNTDHISESGRISSSLLMDLISAFGKFKQHLTDTGEMVPAEKCDYKITTYAIVSGFLGDRPNSYSQKIFLSYEEAEQHWIKEYKNRNKCDGYDEHWNSVPLNIMKVENSIKVISKPPAPGEHNTKS